jgi:hypothetical protein
MRTLKNTRRELHDITRRDSEVNRVQMGYLAAPYDGGRFVRVAVTEEGYGEVTARIPTFLQPPAARTAGAPVTLRVSRGYAEILAWTDPNPIFHYSNPAFATTLSTGSRSLVALTDEDVIRDDLNIFVDGSDHVLIPAGKNGLWSIEYTVQWEANATGYRRLWAQKNGTTDIGAKLEESVANIDWWQTLYREVFLVSSDYVDFDAEQSSGGDLDIEQVYITMRFIRP